jgi:hypothetical protein
MSAIVTRSRVHFALAALLLGGAAAGLESAKERGLLRLIKQPLPIRKPLGDLDRRCLAPLELVSAQKLSPDILQELGTDEYINWNLRAPRSEDRRRAAYLSITYYTGVVDQVPHVPEECMAQGAFTQASDETLEMALPRLGQTIEIRRLTFYPPREIALQTYVYYTICVNGDYYVSRNRVRARMGDLRDTHLYYSKIEIAFKGPAGINLAVLDRQARELFDGALSELVQSHFPLAGWERGGPPPASAPAVAVGEELLILYNPAFSTRRRRRRLIVKNSKRLQQGFRSWLEN